MDKIVILEDGILTYKEVTEESLISLKNEIEEIVKAHKFLKANTDKVCISVQSSNGGKVIISIGDYTYIESICNICYADSGEEQLSIKEAIAFNITNILDNLDDIVTREE